VAQDNYEARKWFRLAAEQGDASGMENLVAHCERAGDRAEAEKWQRKLEEQRVKDKNAKFGRWRWALRW